MLVKFTDPSSKSPFFIDAKNIRVVQRSPANPLISVIVTYFLTPQGAQAIEILEDPETAAELVNEALILDGLTTIRAPSIPRQ